LFILLSIGFLIFTFQLSIFNQFSISNNLIFKKFFDNLANPLKIENS